MVNICNRVFGLFFPTKKFLFEKYFHNRCSSVYSPPFQLILSFLNLCSIGGKFSLGMKWLSSTISQNLLCVSLVSPLSFNIYDKYIFSYQSLLFIPSNCRLLTIETVTHILIFFCFDSILHFERLFLSQCLNYCLRSGSLLLNIDQNFSLEQTTIRWKVINLRKWRILCRVTVSLLLYSRHSLNIFWNSLMLVLRLGINI